jgi:Ala-tRNA(Pro) deacylase
MDTQTPPDGHDLPTTPETLLALLSTLGIPHETVSHEAVFTVEQSSRVNAQHPALTTGVHIKNLFLRNKREEMWLVVAEAHRPIDLKRLGERIGLGRASFGSPERLMKYLGVHPGSVTPFSLVNDTARAVRLAVDRVILEAPRAWAHPLVNTMTVGLSGADLARFFAHTGHSPTVLALD